MFIIKRLPEFDEWFEGLRDRMTSIRLGVRLDKVQRGNLGDVKPVGDGVFEMREFFGPGWRMYYVQHGAVLIVMLGGGDKSREAQINSSWRAITRIGRSAALLFLQITRYLLQKAPCIPSQFERRASTRINLRFPSQASDIATAKKLAATLVFKE